MMVQRYSNPVVWLTCAVSLCATSADAHDGPPFPIISNRTVGAYRVSVWTDPDATDDRSAAGRFWVTIEPAVKGSSVDADVRARVSIRPLDRPGPAESAEAQPVASDPSRQYVALRMDHEGPFAVRVEVEGGTGRAALDSEVSATYDLRPRRILLVLYVMPFLLAGLLWTKLLLRRRRSQSRLA
jgi:hypothetical protein